MYDWSDLIAYGMLAGIFGMFLIGATRPNAWLYSAHCRIHDYFASNPRPLRLEFPDETSEDSDHSEMPPKSP